MSFAELKNRTKNIMIKYDEVSSSSIKELESIATNGGTYKNTISAIDNAISKRQDVLEGVNELLIETLKYKLQNEIGSDFDDMKNVIDIITDASITLQKSIDSLQNLKLKLIIDLI